MSLATTLLQMLREMERVILSSDDHNGSPAAPPTRATVDYYAITPSGTKSRFSNRGVALTNIPGNPRSETAILAYLKKQHPRAEIQINSISFS